MEFVRVVRRSGHLPPPITMGDGRWPQSRSGRHRGHAQHHGESPHARDHCDCEGERDEAQALASASNVGAGWHDGAKFPQIVDRCHVRSSGAYTSRLFDHADVKVTVESARSLQQTRWTDAFGAART